VLTVMSDRPSNQVNNLRALFEQNKNPASPPSRDRSPAGPEAVKGNDSRPVSKVRTNFIAVKRSGPMATAVGVNGVTDDENYKLGQNGGNEFSLGVNGAVEESLKVNGTETLPPLAMKNSEVKVDEGKEPDQPKLVGASSLDQPQTQFSSNAGANKTGSSAKPGARKVNADSPKAADNSETSKSSDQPQDLDATLKGAPLENEAQGNPEALGSHATTNPESESSPKQNALSTPSFPGGQPKNRSGPKTSSPPKAEGGSSRPPAINTKRGGPPEPAKTSATSPTHSKKSPRTPGSPEVASRQPLPKTISPRQSIPAKASSNAGKDTKKAAVPKQPQAPAPAKGLAVTATKPRQGKPSSKKAGPSSPPLKIRPKSPTRPVRLPAGATATTTSSAAKTGEAPTQRPISRTGTVAAPKPSVPNRVQQSGASRDGATTGISSLRKSSSRPSLPAATNPTRKPKARTSTASAKAPEGSFLARMMRPTQSSASKTHEKIDHAAHPGKPYPSKPKRKSGGSDEREQGSDEAPLPSTAPQHEEQIIPSAGAEEQETETVNETEAEPATSAAAEE
jgi:hypothetical protein